MMHRFCTRSWLLNVRKHSWIIATLCVTGAVATAFGDGGTTRKRVLLYLLADPSWKLADTLAECDRLTIQRYRSDGVAVIPRQTKDLETWLAREGEAFAKAHENFQHVAYAKALKADAIGGLNVREVSKEEADERGTRAGSFIYSWGVSLAGCSHNFVLDMSSGNKAQAHALKVGGFFESDPWSIPLSITPEACSMDNPVIEDHPMRGRPFLGVSLDGSTVTRITPLSPADGAGLEKSDEVVAVAGKSITDLADVGAALEDRKPGDEVDLEFRHGGKLIKKRVKLADRYELLEIKPTPVGKPLPNLVAKDINGQDVRLRDLQGKVVLVDFWATWCGPCLEELPLQQLLWEREKKRDFVWIGVSVDEDEQAWKDFVRVNHLGGIQLRSPDWAEAMSISGYPTVLLVDRGGIVQCDLRGTSIAQATSALLDQKTTTP